MTSLHDTFHAANVIVISDLHHVFDKNYVILFFQITYRYFVTVKIIIVLLTSAKNEAPNVKYITVYQSY